MDWRSYVPKSSIANSILQQKSSKSVSGCNRKSKHVSSKQQSSRQHRRLPQQPAPSSANGPLTFPTPPIFGVCRLECMRGLSCHLFLYLFGNSYSLLSDLLNAVLFFLLLNALLYHLSKHPSHRLRGIKLGIGARFKQREVEIATGAEVKTVDPPVSD